MGDGGVSGAGRSSSPQDDERWRVAEEQRTSAVAASSTRISSSPLNIGGYFVPQFTPETFANMQAPAVLGNLGAYDEPMLDRAITATRARLASNSGTSRAADELNLKALEQEQARRFRPAPIDIDFLTTDSQVLDALKLEASFLSRFQTVVPSEVRLQHESTLKKLEQKHDALYAQAHACDNAKVETARFAASANNSYELQFTADDLVNALKNRVPVTPKEEAAVRKEFESWRSNQCATTGVDPTRVRNEDAQHFEKDTNALHRAEMQKRAEMLEASTGSVCAALAFVDSAMRGDSIDAAYARVKGAQAMSDVAMTTVRGPQAHFDTTQPSGRSLVKVESRDGAASKSRLDAPGQSMMSRAEKAALPTFRPNAEGVTRSMSEAVAIAEKQGVTVPSFIKFVADPSVPINESFADYKLGAPYARPPASLTWQDAAPDGVVVVRVHPSVLESDEAIVGVIQHESFELSAVRTAIERSPSGNLSSARISALIDSRSDTNLHGRAWDIADSRVLIMRETDPARKAMLIDRLNARVAQLSRINGG